MSLVSTVNTQAESLEALSPNKVTLYFNDQVVADVRDATFFGDNILLVLFVVGTTLMISPIDTATLQQHDIDEPLHLAGAEELSSNEHVYLSVNGRKGRQIICALDKSRLTVYDAP